MSDGPRILEVTTIRDEIRTYMIGLGVTYDELTDYEKELVRSSKAYIEQCKIDETKELLKLARKDFEKLRDIPDMPDEALNILKQWTYRDEDDFYYNEDDFYNAD